MTEKRIHRIDRYEHPTTPKNITLSPEVRKAWIKRNLLSLIAFVLIPVSIILDNKYFGMVVLVSFFIRILYVNPLDLQFMQKEKKERNPFYMVVKSFVFMMIALLLWHFLFNQ